MAAGTLPLSESYTVQLDASGNGQIIFGPNRQGQTWVPPMTVSFLTSTATKVPIGSLFQGSTNLGSTFTGSNDSTDLPNVTVYPGSKLRATWTGGDAGAIATVSISGTIQQW